MFINYSNHNSAGWMEEQTKAAETYGMIKDILFPAVNPHADADEIALLADSEAEKVAAYIAESTDPENCVMCQGEMGLCFAVAARLLKKGIKVIHATSERHTIESVNENGEYTKTSVFCFVGFREYRM